jgi:uncharacterized cupin superfamily protein
VSEPKSGGIVTYSTAVTLIKDAYKERLNLSGSPTRFYCRLQEDMQVTIMKPKVKKPTEKEREEAESWPTWEKEESKFPWEYDVQETCLILEGNAVIHTPEGNSSSAKATT